MISIKNISKKKQFYLLIAGLIFFVLLAYRISISKTFTLRSECREMELKISQFSNARNQISEMESKLINLKSRIGGTLNQNNNFQEKLLEQTGITCDKYKVKLLEFNDEHEYSQNEYSVKTISLSLQGRFKDILQFIHEIESDQTFCKIVSLNFVSLKDLKTNIKYLKATIYVQSISNKA